MKIVTLPEPLLGQIRIAAAPSAPHVTALVTEDGDERRVNRAGWPKGPWDREPFDVLVWRDQHHPCALWRSGITGTWCGYVGVEPGHPFHGASYDDVSLNVRGGLTFSGTLSLPTLLPPDWFFGFDTAHGMDLMPAMPVTASFGSRYWDVVTVVAEVAFLSRQLAAAAISNEALANKARNVLKEIP